MMVSCVMPTHRGAAVARVAIESFLLQDWYAAKKELIVLDNSEDASVGDMPAMAGVRYRRVPRHSIGELRNIGAEMARGEVICNWDDDDWYAPTRLHDQLWRLARTRKMVTGWHDALYYVPGHAGELFRFLCAGPPYAMGTSQCYWREWWRKHPFPHISSGEDGAFSDAARDAGELDSVDAGRNTVVRQLEPDEPLRALLGKHKQWPAAAREEYPESFFRAIGAGA